MFDSHALPPVTDCNYSGHTRKSTYRSRAETIFRIIVGLSLLLAACGKQEIPVSTTADYGFHYRNWSGAPFFVPADQVELLSPSSITGCPEPCFFLNLKDGRMKWVTFHGYAQHTAGWNTLQPGE